MKIFSLIKSFFTGSLPNINVPPQEPMNICKEITEPLLTISECAKKNGVTRQAIFFAIKMKRLKAKKNTGIWLVDESDLKEYFENKYCRAKSRKQGELIFDKNKGYNSIADAAKFLECKTNHIYYLVRMGKLKSHKHGHAIVIHESELQKYAEFVKQTSKNMSFG